MARELDSALTAPLIVEASDSDMTTGGAPYVYTIHDGTPNCPMEHAIVFQNGTIPEVGINGITIESLLAVCADRLDCFQQGPFASQYNATALSHIRSALESLHARTKERKNRGVEGTYIK